MPALQRSWWPRIPKRPLRFVTQAGRAYLVRLAAGNNGDLPFEEVSGIPATVPKSLGSRIIGIPR